MAVIISSQNHKGSVWYGFTTQATYMVMSEQLSYQTWPDTLGMPCVCTLCVQLIQERTRARGASVWVIFCYETCAGFGEACVLTYRKIGWLEALSNWSN